MAGLADLVERSQPAFFGAGGRVSATRGMDWSWTIVDVLDDDGTPIDLTTGTHVCRIEWDGSLVKALNVAGGIGEFTFSLDEAETATVAPGRYSLVIVLDDGTNRLAVCGPENTDFEVRAGVGV